MEEKHSWKKAGGDTPLDDFLLQGDGLSPWRSVRVQGRHVPFGRSLSQVTRSYYYLVERLQRQLVHLCLQYFFLQLKDVLPEKNACFLSLYLLLVWLMKLHLSGHVRGKVFIHIIFGVLCYCSCQFCGSSICWTRRLVHRWCCRLQHLIPPIGVVI